MKTEDLLILKKDDLMKITFITAVFKGNEYIPGLLNIIDLVTKKANEKHPLLEVEYILVNDFPEIPIETSGVVPVSYSYRIINNKTNQGIHQTRVNGLNEAKGSYITFLDQDDSIEENFLQIMIDNLIINNYPDVLVAGAWREKKGVRRRLYKDVIKQKLVCKTWPFVYAANQIASPGQTLIKKSSIPKEWCDNILLVNGSDDMMLWLIMKDRKLRFSIITECLYVHHDMDTSLTNDAMGMVNSCFAVCDLLDNKQLVNKKMAKNYRRQIELTKKLLTNKEISKISSLIFYSDIIFCKVVAHYI